MKQLDSPQLLIINGGSGGNYTLPGQHKGDIKKCILSFFKKG
ncbi:EntF family bacteriocin induction factor [Staphylococcus aureus]|nr:EntF family bacteriocin induction factor [Staphylococcus aureus]